MCECRPTRSRLGSFAIRRTASSAAPEPTDSPNFWSSCAVAMNSCVCASTPTVTRTRTGWTMPARAAASATRTMSSNESMTIRPTRAATAASISSADLLLPCMRSRSPGTPARRATASSPPDATSMPSPSSVDPPRDGGRQEGLGRVVHEPGARVDVGAAVPASTVAQVGLVEQEQRRGSARRRRPGRRRRRSRARRSRCVDRTPARRAARGRSSPATTRAARRRHAPTRRRRGEVQRDGRAHVKARPSAAAYMRSGALTPSRPRPFAIV